MNETGTVRFERAGSERFEKGNPVYRIDPPHASAGASPLGLALKW